VGVDIRSYNTVVMQLYLLGTDKIEKTSILFAVSGILLELICKQPPTKAK